MTDMNSNNITLAEALTFIKESGWKNILIDLQEVALQEIELGLDGRDFEIADAISQAAYTALHNR